MIKFESWLYSITYTHYLSYNIWDFIFEIFIRISAEHRIFSMNFNNEIVWKFVQLQEKLLTSWLYDPIFTKMLNLMIFQTGLKFKIFDKSKGKEAMYGKTPVSFSGSTKIKVKKWGFLKLLKVWFEIDLCAVHSKGVKQVGLTLDSC